MASSIIGLLVVPLLDQVVKLGLRHRLQRGSIPLGWLGTLRVTHREIWIMRAPVGWTLRTIWLLWLVAAATLMTVTAMVPSVGIFSALLLGGSLSHALETSLRHTICDYICLRFGPAFDLADVALTVGVFGTVLQLVRVAPEVWR